MASVVDCWERGRCTSQNTSQKMKERLPFPAHLS
jgi:hypothetical protein